MDIVSKGFAKHLTRFFNQAGKQRAGQWVKIFCHACEIGLYLLVATPFYLAHSFKIILINGLSLFTARLSQSGLMVA